MNILDHSCIPPPPQPGHANPIRYVFIISASVISKTDVLKKVNKNSPNNSRFPGIFHPCGEANLISIVMLFRGCKITTQRASCVFTHAGYCFQVLMKPVTAPLAASAPTNTQTSCQGGC